VPVVGFLDLALSRYSGGAQLGDDIGDETLTLADRAVDLDPAEPADREFVYVQDYDLVTGLGREVPDRLDRSGHVTTRLVARRIDGKQHRRIHFRFVSLLS